MSVHQKAPMIFKCLHVKSLGQCLGMLLPGLDVVGLDDGLIHGVWHNMMLSVDVLRATAAEPIGVHFIAPLLVLDNRDFAIHGRHHKCLQLPQETDLVDNFSKPDVFRLRCSSLGKPLCPREPAECPLRASPRLQKPIAAYLGTLHGLSQPTLAASSSSDPSSLMWLRDPPSA